MVSKRQVDSLVSGYKRAASALDELVDPMERDVGRTALALSARSILVEITSSGDGVPETRVASLRAWIDGYKGEGISKKFVEGIDDVVKEGAQQGVEAVAKWAWSGAVPFAGSGIVGFLVGIPLLLIDFGEAVGAWILVAASAIGISGSVVLHLIGAAMHSAGNELDRTMKANWKRVSHLGRLAEDVLVETSLPREHTILNADRRETQPGLRFIKDARVRAKSVVGFAYAIGAVGYCLFMFGLVVALSS